MSDYDSSLPVRSECDGSDEHVRIKIVDGTGTLTNIAAVDSDNNVHVEVHGNRADDAADQVLLVSELGAAVVDGIYEVDDNSNPSNIGLVAAVRAASPADADQTQRLTAKTGTVDTDVHALDVSLHDQSGNGYTVANPLPVTLSEIIPGATAVLDHDSAAKAAGAAFTYTYTIAAGKDLILKKIMASGSGKMKMEIKIGAIGSEVLVAVMFNSTANPNCEYTFAVPEIHADTEAVVVILTNRDNQSQDLYVTLEGYEI